VLLGFAATAFLILWWIIDAGYKPPIRVAINPWPGYEFATLAQAKGYFAEEGVDVRLIELSSLGDSRRAYERGQVDGFFGTVVEVLLSGDQGDRRPIITMLVDYSDGADVIVARQGIPDIAGLRGKRVAVESGSINVVVLARALAGEGMDSSEVTPVYEPQLDMARSFVEGRIDAAVCYPPTSIEIVKSGAGVIYSSKAIPGVIADVLAFDSATIKDRSADVAAFQRAFFRAQEFALTHPDEAYALMAAREGITAEEFAEALHEGIRLVGSTEQATYLGPSGSLVEVVRTTRDDLRSLGQLRDGDRELPRTVMVSPE
jgi:NitT/TauT family transport system substrate-binding protein